jgi:small basic protein
MVIANSIANNMDIYFGYSNGTFSKQIGCFTGSHSTPYMVTVGILSGDSYLDIVVANFGTNNIGIFLGLGNGSFIRQTELSTGSSRPIFISLIDLNNDTLLDIVTVNYGTDSISILNGYGNGSFSTPITYRTGYDSLPLSLTAGDFNNDNYLDIAIVNSGTNNIGILLAKSNGTFEKQIYISTGFGSRPHSIAVGHFNDDNLIDIAVANYGTNNIGVLLSYGNGTFANRTTYSLGSASPHSIGVSDFNRDNRMDIVAINKGQNNTAILIGYGNGSFENSLMTSIGSSLSISLAIGDLNKDDRC